eukprot:TRINITY_DN5595_c1_g1_i1.p1 TRINITY_DN5595_c1_g1~~TRINITY_DN5595_c1_g1_i1.p1  ORF type:complete len:190 (+),score=19.83 TRINITY_DN5595_c1_g1_i1:41-610(+)
MLRWVRTLHAVHPRVGGAFLNIGKVHEVEVLLLNPVGGTNLGGCLRTAECAGVRKVYYTRREKLQKGVNDAAVRKTALGATDWVPMEHITSPAETVERANQDGHLTLLVDPRASVPMSTFLGSLASRPSSVLLVFPNEFLEGVDDQLPVAASVSPSQSAFKGPDELVVRMNLTSSFATAVYRTVEWLRK